MPARTVAIILSLLAHGSLAFALTRHTNESRLEALDGGAGDDMFTVEQGIAIEGAAKLGDAMETIETAEVVPVTETPPPPPPVEEVKPLDELREAITSEASKVEDNIVKLDEPPPPDVAPPTPEVVEAQEQPQQVAIVSEQSSGEAKTGGNSTARTEYLGKLRNVLERAKVNPRSRLAGTVVVKFQIGPDGQLMSREITTSSGSKVLDDAAVAALDRAAPFPPMPVEVAGEPMVVSVPFKFITR
ncbi:MAG: energy transducer TonB family protein [Hyphomicrobium sp.]